MSRSIRSVLCLMAVVSLISCQSKTETTTETATQQKQEPQYVTVQHILVAFQGSVPGRPIARSQEEAQRLAQEVLERARAGEDFDALVKAYTADSHPGIYTIANDGVAGDPSRQIYQRGGMAKGFGDVGFALAVGEIGMASYDRSDSPYGWHIIKRIE